MEVVSAYAQKIKFVIGFAGSGKSTLLAERCHNDSLVMTPTHKAAAVLMAKGIKNVYTLHSVLKLVPTINESFRKGQRMERIKKIGDTDLSKIKEVFVDEYSMVSTQIADILLNALPEHCIVTFIGDAFQLSLVDGEAIDPLDYTDESNIEELTTQYRADAPEVVETFMRMMHYIKTGDHRISLKLNDNIKKGTLKDFNPETDRCLAYTNKKVIQLNDEIAGHLGLTKGIQVGDPITVNGIDAVLTRGEGLGIFPNCMAKGRLMEDNDLLMASQKTLSDIEKYSTHVPFPQCTITINDEVYFIYCDLEHNKTSKKLKKAVETWQHQLISHHSLPKDVNIPQWCRENKGAKFIKERGKAWSEYLAHKSLVFDLRRPYATTVHKSQGSEFDTVYIAQSDIKLAIRNNYYEQYARLMYVALSRAQHKVVIV